MSKLVIIARHNCREFAHKLWNDMAVYAYAYTVEARVINLARFETGPLALLHTAIALIIRRATSSVQYVFLPPTTPLEGKFIERKVSYFFGWLHRNPRGFAVHRSRLLKQFGPTPREEAALAKARRSFTSGGPVIGIHMRRTPFPYFPDGEFLMPPERVQEIVREYLRERKLSREQVTLVLAADQPIRNLFRDFNAYEVEGGERAKFLMLSRCDVIIGTNSAFPNLAAWFGDVPHVVTTKKPINWEYYRGKERYFENTYATFTLGAPGQD